MNREISILSRDESFRSIVVVTPEASQVQLGLQERRMSHLRTESVVMDIQKYLANHRHVRAHSTKENEEANFDAETVITVDAGSLTSRNEEAEGSEGNPIPPPPPPQSDQIAFFGDFKLFREHRFSVHKSVRDIFSKASLIVGNIEMVVTPIPMSPEEVARRTPVRVKSRDVRRVVDRATVNTALTEMGVDPSKCIFSVANNHAGLFDLDKTVESLQSLGAVVIGHVAGGMLTKVLVGSSYVGFVAWTKSVGKNGQAAVWTQQDIETVDWNKIKADMDIRTLIAFPHWDGRLTSKSASKDRAKLAQKLLSQGFDMIVGHGSHNLQSCEHVNNHNNNQLKIPSLEETGELMEDLEVLSPNKILPSPNTQLTTLAPNEGMQLCVFGLGHINSKLPSRKLSHRLGGIFTVTLDKGKISKYVIDPIVHTLTNDNRGGGGGSGPKASRNHPALTDGSKTLIAHERVKVRQHTMVHTLESAPPMNDEIRSLDKRLHHLFPSYNVPLTGYLHGLNELVTRRHRYSVKLFSPDEGHASLSVRLIGDRAQGVWHDLQMGSGRKLFRAHHMPRFFFNERRYLGTVTHLKLLIRRTHTDDTTACTLTRIHVTYIGSTSPGAEYPAEQFDFPVTDDPENKSRRMSFWGVGARPGLSLKRSADMKVLIRMDPDHTNRPPKEDDVAVLRLLDEQVMSCIKTGDCIAFASKSRLAPYTRRMTGSPITHVGSVVVKQGQSDSQWRPIVLLYEATLNGDGTQDFAMQRSHGTRKHLGVWGFSLVERVLSYGGDAWYVPLREDCNLSSAQQDLFAAFLKRVHMDLVPYDKTQLVTQAFGRLTGIELDPRHNDISKLFCSEMVAEAVRQAGIAAVQEEAKGAVINPIWHSVAQLRSSEMSPVDCCRLPIFVPEPFVKIKSYL